MYLVFPLIAASVLLAWDASPEEDMVSYRLHWGLSPGGEDQFVDTGLSTSGSVDDPSWLPGDTIYFVATAVNSVGLESPPSNEVSWPVPLPSPHANASTHSYPHAHSGLRVFAHDHLGFSGGQLHPGRDASWNDHQCRGTQAPAQKVSALGGGHRNPQQLFFQEHDRHHSGDGHGGSRRLRTVRQVPYLPPDSQLFLMHLELGPGVDSSGGLEFHDRVLPGVTALDLEEGYHLGDPEVCVVNAQLERLVEDGHRGVLALEAQLELQFRGGCCGIRYTIPMDRLDDGDETSLLLISHLAMDRRVGY